MTTNQNETFDIKFYNKELRKILVELDSILSECSSNCNDDYSIKSVHYIRRNKRDKVDFVDILLKEHRRVEKMVDMILEETNYNNNKQKKLL